MYTKWKSSVVVFCIVIQCSIVGGWMCFGGICCNYLDVWSVQGQKLILLYTADCRESGHSDPWEMIIHAHRRWPLRFLRGHADPWELITQTQESWSLVPLKGSQSGPREMVTQTPGGSHVDQWKWQGSGTRSWNGELQDSLFRATMLLFLTLHTSVLNMDATYLLETYVTA
jgi:hypothetical protein